MGKHEVLLIILLIFVAATRDTVAERPLRIVSGDTTYEGEFPFVVSLRYDGQFHCGGTIISSKHILTAAHCIEHRVADRFIVRSGTIFREQLGQDHYVSYIAQHPIFDRQDASTYGCDIAVMTLTAPITMDNMNSIIPIARSDTPEGSIGQFIGWGQTQVVGSPSEIQRKAYARTISHEQCKTLIGKTIVYEQLCTMQPPGVGACMGDSGGPLVFNNEVVGVASWAFPCAYGIPDIYTRVYSHRRFIQAAMTMYP